MHVESQDQPEAGPPLKESVKQWIQKKSLWRKLKVVPNEHMNDKKTKHSNCWYGESSSGLDKRLNQPPHSLHQCLIQNKGLTQQCYKSQER